MYYKKQFATLKNRLQNQYSRLIEISESYKFLDEPLSDLAAFKAMKLMQKLNKVSYLDREVTI
ncbi:hypothetical protein [Polaribacter porphyrae]|uniref:Lacal_2735 family protein n=1 Tax=Polaribacter porphyrae TaxID=1137780 RepID=A0A2S7WT59_9FLAO|nr:hypothetical protein [Polaribacter porphyrae]PQJ80795.1 hypothetical protein BTO18_17160 [Polaribacter porphyrae]